jgi:hypothetical protein
VCSSDLCSFNNLAQVSTCVNNPDNNPDTLDYFVGFTSTCDEAADSCTTGTISFTHTCNVLQCGAQCAADSDCNDMDPTTLDTCLGDCTCTHEKSYAPTISVPDQQTDEDTAPPSRWVDLWSYSDDADTAKVNLSFSIVSQSDAGLIRCSISSNRYFECGTPAKDGYGSSDITVRVSDGKQSALGTFTITVNPVNDAPVIDPIPVVFAMEGQTVQVNPTATDAEGDAVTFSFTSPLDSTGRWTTRSGDAGNYLVRVTADDGNGGTSSLMVEINVLETVPTTDLVVKSAKVLYPKTPKAREWMTFQVFVENKGAIAAENIYWTFDTGSSDAGISFGPFTLNPGKTVDIYPEIKYSAAGKYNPTFRIDSNNTVRESDETNNIAVIPLTVS